MLPSPLVVDIRRGAVAALPDLLGESFISTGGRVLVAVGPSQGEAIWQRLRDRLPQADVFAVSRGSLKQAGKLQAALGRHSYDAVVAIGGGRILDVAKYAATRAAVPMVAVSTNLAHDGICSPVASLENKHGKGSYGVAMPLAVLVDLDYVRAAPPDLVNAGVGDVISNLSAIEDWHLAQRERGEPVDGLAAALAQSAAHAVLGHPGTVEDDDFLSVLAEALVLSGMAMAVAGSSRPCSGACHEVIHAVDQLFPGVSNHGELAGIGALLATYLRGDEAMFAAMRECLARHDLATGPAAVGLDEEQFVQAVLKAPTTRPDRYTILEHLDLDEQQTRARVGCFLGHVQPG